VKRNIVFIVVLLCLLTAIVSAEKIYTSNFKKVTDDIINKNDYLNCAQKLCEVMEKRKIVNRLFYSKDITHQIINEAKKLEVYATQNELSDAKASVENIRFLLKSLCRFNESKL